MRVKHSTRSLRYLGTLFCLIAGLYSCQAPAPRNRAESRLGLVRAGTQEMADDVAIMVNELHPRVAECLPDVRETQLDVWVQKEPMLYRFLSSSYEEADGFWAELPGRIHLRRDADDIRRTLAHELTHAALGASWRFLPGTIEEGLCDLVSAKLCPEGAPAMRAGRLSAASFAIGGLELELQLDQTTPAGELIASYSARILLQSSGPELLDPLEVFDVRAGLSTTTVDPIYKKAFYGLSYLVVDRIVDRGGVEQMHELCLRAERQDRDEIASSWLLKAAGLDSRRSSWQAAIADAFGPRELEELVDMYPQFLSEALKLCRNSFPPLQDTIAHDGLELRLTLPGNTASVALDPYGRGRLPVPTLAAAN